MNKVHFNRFPTYSKGFHLGIGACGVILEVEDYQYCTTDKKKVTCRNCKRTKLMRKKISFIRRIVAWLKKKNIL